MKYRFNYHYNKLHNKITVHYKGKCHLVSNLVCNVVVESKFNKNQPRFVMQGWCNNLIIKKDKAEIV